MVRLVIERASARQQKGRGEGGLLEFCFCFLVKSQGWHLSLCCSFIWFRLFFFCSSETGVWWPLHFIFIFRCFTCRHFGCTSAFLLLFLLFSLLTLLLSLLPLSSEKGCLEQY